VQRNESGRRESEGERRKPEEGEGTMIGVRFEGSWATFIAVRDGIEREQLTKRIAEEYGVEGSMVLLVNGHHGRRTEAGDGEEVRSEPRRAVVRQNNGRHVQPAGIQNATDVGVRAQGGESPGN
jgi:hypothetical protein